MSSGGQPILRYSSTNVRPISSAILPSGSAKVMPTISIGSSSSNCLALDIVSPLFEKGPAQVLLHQLALVAGHEAAQHRQPLPLAVDAARLGPGHLHQRLLVRRVDAVGVVALAPADGLPDGVLAHE